MAYLPRIILVTEMAYHRSFGSIFVLRGVLSHFCLTNHHRRERTEEDNTISRVVCVGLI